jgi:hypothetical protein
MMRFASSCLLAAACCSFPLIGGCASEQPHALTGGEAAKHQPTYAEKQPYIDAKGHYHLDQALHDHPDWEINQGI